MNPGTKAMYCIQRRSGRKMVLREQPVTIVQADPKFKWPRVRFPNGVERSVDPKNLKFDTETETNDTKGE